MEPSNWVSVGALGVAAMSIIVSGFIAPRIGARIERDHRIGVARSDVYTDTIRLLRARLSEIEQASFGHPPPEDDASLDVEGTMSRLKLYANEAIVEGVAQFVRLYWSASPARSAAEFATAQHIRDLEARREIGDVADRMGRLLDAITNQMRREIGTAALFPTRFEQPEHPTERHARDAAEP